MLRPWALLPLVAAAGCLYTGSRNEPPRMTIELSAGMIYRGETVAANVVVEDDQNDTTVVRQLMKIRLLDAHDQPVTDDCVGTVVQSSTGGQLVVYTPGHYSLAVTSSDELGAVASQTLAFEVVDAPPAFSIGARPQADSHVNACSAYTAGLPIVVQLDGSASDPDADPPQPATASCVVSDETLTYEWSVVMAPAGAHPLLGPTVDGSCPDDAPAGAGPTLALVDAKAQICLYPDKSVAGDKAGYYALAVSVSDGVNPPVESLTQSPVAVVADQPPCITGTVPGGGLRVVDRSALQTFTITGVVDDLDPYGSAQLRYLWSVWRTSDPSWRAVDDNDASYQLDTSGFDVGENVQVRVEVDDRNRTPASCPTDSDECLASSCLLAQPNSCLRWMTWSLELR